MINQIINSLYPNWSKEKISSISNFLQKQDISDPEIAGICFSLLGRIFEFCISKSIDIELIFDERIKIGKKEISSTITHEQIFEMGMINGVSVEDAIQNVLLLELTKEICKDFNSKKVYLTTNKQFFEYKVRDKEEFKKEVVLTAHCKVLTLKDLRKLKLDKINNSL